MYYISILYNHNPPTFFSALTTQGTAPVRNLLPSTKVQHIPKVHMTPVLTPLYWLPIAREGNRATLWWQRRCYIKNSWNGGIIINKDTHSQLFKVLHSVQSANSSLSPRHATAAAVSICRCWHTDMQHHAGKESYSLCSLDTFSFFYSCCFCV